MAVRHPWDLIHALSHAEHLLTRRITAVLADDGLSVEAWRVLSLLSDDAGHPMTAVADFALMPPPSLTKLVDRMVSDNLVYRRVDPADRRRVLLHLSARGRTRHQHARQRVDQELATLLTTAATPEDETVDLLRRLAAAAENVATPADLRS